MDFFSFIENEIIGILILNNMGFYIQKGRKEILRWKYEINIRY